jgi:hypothetical protein
MSNSQQQLAGRVEELRLALREKGNPQNLAFLSGGEFHEKGRSEFRLPLFGNSVSVSYPDLVACDAQTGVSLPVATQALLLYYLNTADGTPLEGRWIAFAELPDGRFYNQAFQGYTGQELARHFGNDLGTFERTARKMDGMKLGYSDASFAFHILPRVMLAVVHHLGDEDFPATCQILFDASACHYLPTDVCAILGSMLTRKLLV